MAFLDRLRAARSVAGGHHGPGPFGPGGGPVFPWMKQPPRMGIRFEGMGSSAPVSLSDVQAAWLAGMGSYAPRPGAVGKPSGVAPPPGPSFAYPSVLFGVPSVGMPGGPMASQVPVMDGRPEDYYRPQGGR